MLGMIHNTMDDAATMRPGGVSVLGRIDKYELVRELGEGAGSAPSTSLDGGKLVVRVLDFGLAAEIRSSMGRLSREIRDTSGTRPYLPTRLKSRRASPRTCTRRLPQPLPRIQRSALPPVATSSPRCRSASRDWNAPLYCGNYCGFRLCCSEMPPQ